MLKGKITSPDTGYVYAFEVTPEVYGESMGFTDPRYRDDCGCQVTVTAPGGFMGSRWVDSYAVALGGERDAIIALTMELEREVYA